MPVDNDEWKGAGTTEWRPLNCVLYTRLIWHPIELFVYIMKAEIYSVSLSFGSWPLLDFSILGHVVACSCLVSQMSVNC